LRSNQNSRFQISFTENMSIFEKSESTTEHIYASLFAK
jgi:hypothetical protein